MIEIGVFHNGASDLPAVTTPDGVVVNDGSLQEVNVRVHQMGPVRVRFLGRKRHEIGCREACCGESDETRHSAHRIDTA